MCTLPSCDDMVPPVGGAASRMHPNKEAGNKHEVSLKDIRCKNLSGPNTSFRHSQTTALQAAQLTLTDPKQSENAIPSYR